MCKKDLLIVLDTSYSIGQGIFDSKVKPFLINLVKSPKLNVGPQGTHLALIIFSNAKNTRLLFDFGKKMTTKELEDYIIDELVWNKVSGDFTMTGTALKIASEKVRNQVVFSGVLNFSTEVKVKVLTGSIAWAE